VGGLIPPPHVLGFPSKFSTWRPEQESSILQCLDKNRKPTVVLNMPTGSGKSGTAVGYAAISGLRTLILTSTKALQQQYGDDFADCGIVDIRGASNYPCVQLLPGGDFEEWNDGRTDCGIGPCKFGVTCRYMSYGCSYYDQLKKANKAGIVITSYAKWLAEGISSAEDSQEALGKFDCIIVDEAHEAADEVCKALQCELDSREVESVLKIKPLKPGNSIREWREWGEYASKVLDTALAKTKRQFAVSFDESLMLSLHSFRSLRQKLTLIANMEGQWIAIKKDKYVTVFAPIWAGPYVERLLFRGIKYRVLMSATIRPKEMKYLDIPQDDYEFTEYPSSFPVWRRPVYKLRTGIALKYDTPPENLRIWARIIDRIISMRLDRNGIIHTVSYDRMRYILRNSEYSDIMMTHDSKSTEKVIKEFKKAASPRILLSPVVDTGYDFPYRECEYQIIAKLPFPNTEDPVIKARSKLDPEYGGHTMIKTVQQETGRGMRAEDDQCENVITDDQCMWALNAFKDSAPKYWNASVRYANDFPKPPKRLEVRKVPKAGST